MNSNNDLSNGSSSSPTPKTKIEVKSIQVYGLMILSSLIYCAFVQKNLNQLTHIPLDPREWLHFGNLILLSIAILFVLARIFDLSFVSYRVHRTEMYKIIGPLSFSSAIFLAFIAAFGEELLFRGIVQHYLDLALTSILVGILHISPQGSLSAWSLFGFLTSLLLGVVFDHTKTLVPSFIIHFALNLYYFIQLHFFARRNPTFFQKQNDV